MGPFFIVLGLICAGFIGVDLISVTVFNDSLASYERAEKRKKYYVSPRLFTLVILCWLIAAFCPSSETMYAIAASQSGEQVLKTPLANKAEKALEVWLDKQAANK